MATHSSILAWEIPWIGETCWLQSIGSQTRLKRQHTHIMALTSKPSVFKVLLCLCDPNDYRSRGFLLVTT